MVKSVFVADANLAMILLPAGAPSEATAAISPLAGEGSLEFAEIAAECDGISTFCFPAGTPVATSAGSVAIEAIRVGNEVWAYDLISSQWRLCRVLQTFVHDHEGTSAFITVQDETIESTSGHPFWVVRGDDLASRRCPEHIVPPEGATNPGRWVEAGDVPPGDEVLLRDGRSRFRPCGMSRSGERSIISRSPSLKAMRLDQ